jgi:SAM-dependent methyltransferase
MAAGQAGIEQLKQRMRASWMAGDFGQVAKYSAKHAEEFVNRLGIQKGAKVLDVACGTGNTAIPAARAGAAVTGVDIAPNLLEQARQRAAAEGLTIHFEEGDAEQLPYENGEFDVIISMFGAMFAPRPDRVAAELIRVCRPGGMIAMANWTPDGFAAKTFRASARFLPPPEEIPAPVLWGDEATVQERLGAGSSDIRMTHRPFDMEFPFGPRETVGFFRNYFGPVLTAFSRMTPEQQQDYAADLERFWSESGESGPNRTVVRTDYLEVIATRAER